MALGIFFYDLVTGIFQGDTSKNSLSKETCFYVKSTVPCDPEIKHKGCRSRSSHCYTLPKTQPSNLF